MRYKDRTGLMKASIMVLIAAYKEERAEGLEDALQAFGEFLNARILDLMVGATTWPQMCAELKALEDFAEEELAAKSNESTRWQGLAELLDSWANRSSVPLAVLRRGGGAIQKRILNLLAHEPLGAQLERCTILQGMDDDTARQANRILEDLCAAQLVDRAVGGAFSISLYGRKFIERPYGTFDDN